MKHPIENAAPTGPVEESKPRRTSTMSPAAIAANRANAQKSTGPRTPAGKTRAASNNYRHGLYRVEGYSDFSSTFDYSLTVAHNLLEQFNPVTPTEHTLVHTLVTLQLRFHHMEVLYQDALTLLEQGKPEPKHLALVLRELDRIPYRYEKTLKLLRSEQAQRAADAEPIDDFAPLTPRDPKQAEKSDSNPKPHPDAVYIQTFLDYLSLRFGHPNAPALFQNLLRDAKLAVVKLDSKPNPN